MPYCLPKAVFLLGLLASGVTFSQARDPIPEAELERLGKAFIAAKNARQQPDTTLADIDHFLSLFADEFVDEHIKFGVTVTSKQDFRQNLVLKMKDQVDYSRIEIRQMMLGSWVVMIKYTESGRVKPTHMDRYVEYSGTHIVSLEYDGQGKITRLRRHHG